MDLRNYVVYHPDIDAALLNWFVGVGGGCPGQNRVKMYRVSETVPCGILHNIVHADGKRTC